MEEMNAAMSALQTWMAISAVLYTVGGLSFLFGQNLLLENINNTSEKLFGDRFPRIPLSTEKFWLVLTVSMMAMLVTLSVYAAVDIERYYMMVPVVIVSKAVSTLQYSFHFATKRYFAHAVGALTDGPLFLITLILFLRLL